MRRPQDVAINATTGDIFVADYLNHRVDRFDENGVFERAWGWDVDADNPETEFEVCVAPATCKAGVGGYGPGQLRLPRHIAVDQASGDVYVSGADSSQVVKYDEDGNYLLTISDLAYESPGNAGSSLAIKPGSDTLLVGDASSSSSAGRIYWLDSSGNRLLNFKPGFSAYKIGTDANGDIYVIPSQDANASATVFKLGPSGTPSAKFAPSFLDGFGPEVLEADPVNDRIYVSRFDRKVTSSHPANALTQIAEFDPTGDLIDLHATGMPTPAGIAVNSSTGRIYAAIESGSRILEIDTVANPPVPTITSIDSVTDSSATLSGTVDPQGTAYATGYHWEYRIAGAPSWTVTPAADVDVDVGNGSGTEPAGPQVLAGLEPNTSYEVRLVATRASGAGFAVDTDSFTTLPLGPTVTERSAYPVGLTTAQLRGVVHPRKSDTEYYFEYGEDTSYGQTTPVQSAGDGNQDVPAYATIEGLEADTTYHFHLVADNGVGDPVEGDDVEFRTQTAAEFAWPTRGTELVTPPNTGSQNPSALLARESDRAVWSTLTGAPGSPTGSGGAFLAERTLKTPTGWESSSLLPSVHEMVGNGESLYVPIRAANDFSRAAFYVNFNNRIFFTRLGTGGEQEVLTDVLSPSTSSNSGFVSASSDVRHVFLRWSEPLVAEHTEAESSEVYDLGYGGTPRLVSRMPDNSVPKCGVVDSLQGNYGSGFEGGPYRWFSDDRAGQPFRLYFETAGEDCTTPGDADDTVNLYMRDDQGTAAEADDETTLVSGPVLSGPDEGGLFLRTNAAGDQVVYVSSSRLDPDDANSTPDLYKWTLGEGNRCLTCVVADADVIHSRGYDRGVVVSPDLSRAYFRSEGQLVPGEGIAGSQNNVYVVRDLDGEPEIDYVGQGGTEQGSTEISDDGEVIAFRSEAAGVTPDRTGGFSQFYRYDDTEGSTECITCPPPGVPAGEIEGTNIGGFSGLAIYNLADPKLLDAAGDIFVFSSSVPYVKEDVNGTIDVYEWHRDGRLRLVTDGVTRFPSGPGAPALQGISASGDNIMFSVGAKLTGWELERTRQVYVAKVGGGFPPPDPPTEPCVEDACQGPLVPAPPLHSPASASFQGRGNVTEAAARKPRCRHGKVRRKGRCIKKKHRRKAVCAKKRGKAKKRCVRAHKRHAANKRHAKKVRGSK